MKNNRVLNKSLKKKKECTIIVRILNLNFKNTSL